MPDNMNLCIEADAGISNGHLQIRDIRTVQQYYGNMPDMNTPGPSRAIFNDCTQQILQVSADCQSIFSIPPHVCLCRDTMTPGQPPTVVLQDPQQITCHSMSNIPQTCACACKEEIPSGSPTFFDDFDQLTELPTEEEPITGEEMPAKVIPCTCVDMGTPGPSRVIFNECGQQISQDQDQYQSISNQVIPCTCLDMRTPGPSKSIFNECSKPNKLVPSTCIDMRTPGPSKSVFGECRQQPISESYGIPHQDSEYFSVFSNTDGESHADEINRKVVRKTASQRNRQVMAVNLLNEVLKMMTEDGDDSETRNIRQEVMSNTVLNIGKSREVNLGDEEESSNMKLTVTSQHTSSHVNMNNVSETEDRWILTTTMQTWQPGSETINFGPTDLIGTDSEVAGEPLDDPKISTIPESTSPGESNYDKEYEGECSDPLISTNALDNEVAPVSICPSMDEISQTTQVTQQLNDSSCNAEDQCPPENIKQKPDSKVCKPKPQMMEFVNSLLCDLEAIRQNNKKILCKLPERQSYGKVSIPRNFSRNCQRAKRTAKSYVGCIPESFPVTITSVKKIGQSALYVKWVIHDCANIGGYEIYVDNYLSNRYFNGNHSAAMLCQVDVTQSHKISLVAIAMVAHGQSEEVADGPPYRCPVGIKKWTPSIYLFDPNITP